VDRRSPSDRVPSAGRRSTLRQTTRRAALDVDTSGMPERRTPLWDEMDARLRRRLDTLRRRDVPTTPGVYALYRNGDAQYVGKASSLRTRFWGKHMGRGASMTGSALRRNVTDLLGIASAADIKARRYLPTADDAARVVAWIRACEVAWIETPTPADALDLEDAMKAEKLPPLTKR